MATPEVMDGTAPAASARDQASKANDGRGTHRKATRVPHRLMRSLQPRLDLIALVKPQFELSRGEVGKGGVVRDAAAQQRAYQVVDKIRWDGMFCRHDIGYRAIAREQL